MEAIAWVLCTLIVSLSATGAYLGGLLIRLGYWPQRGN